MKKETREDWTCQARKLIAQLQLMAKILGYQDLNVEVLFNVYDEISLFELLNQIEDFFVNGGNPN